MSLDPELTAQPRRVLAALEPLLPRPARPWVARLAVKSGAATPGSAEAGAEAEAILWSQKKGDRSGGIAWQFACAWVGRQALARLSP